MAVRGLMRIAARCPQIKLWIGDEGEGPFICRVHGPKPLETAMIDGLIASFKAQYPHAPLDDGPPIRLHQLLRFAQ